MQMPLFVADNTPITAIAGPVVAPYTAQLLKWVGNKQQFAHEIASYFPAHFGTYHEPFLGSGAVLGTLAPPHAIASDVFAPLVEIWETLHNDHETLKRWYVERWRAFAQSATKEEAYERIKASYNAHPNGADLLFLSRSCYGGVVRFRKKDGYMSTPVGAHKPMPPRNFDRRVNEWHWRTRGTHFVRLDFEDAMDRARTGDLVYCDPPYSDTQAILYGAQAFSLARLFQAIERCKNRGVYVALSIDGTKKSGGKVIDLPIPAGLFEREAFVHCGRSMLRRFQREGETLEDEVVTDRLLLTY